MASGRSHETIRVTLILVFGWLITSPFLEIEEPALEDRFGDAYHRYKSRVRRSL